MIRSLVFTTQGKLHSRDVELLLLPGILSDTNLFLWVDLESSTPEENQTILEQVFHFHPLSIEDCVTFSPIPKADEYLPGDGDQFAHYLFVVVHGVDQECKDRVLAARIAELEQQALQYPSKETLNQILRTKKEVRHLLAIISPQREVVARFARGEFNLIRARLLPYYRDVYDALLQVSDLAQGYADSLTGTLQVYLNMSSNQTGEVVKVLTLITVITTPFMMIGTWYGMNFKDMPELSWRYGYPMALGVTLAATLGAIWYFKLKKWF